MKIFFSNLISSLLGKPKYLPLYKKVGDDFIHVGYIKEDLSAGLWYNKEYMSSPIYTKISDNDMFYILSTINVYDDGYSFGNGGN